jgi:phosphonate transport system substrate-binding protein
MKTRGIWVLVAVLALIVAACGDGDSEATTTTEEAATTTTAAPATTTSESTVDVGTAENPIQVLFVPSVAAEEIVAGGELLAETLGNATGLVFEVSVPTSYAATVEAICAAPDTSMGFIPAQAYVLASELCDVDIQLKAKRFGYTEYWTQYLVPRDSDAASIENLAGLSWAYPDPGSTSGFLVPSGELLNAGVEVGEELQAGSHDGAVRAVAQGEAEFGTSFYSPYTDTDRNAAWDGDIMNADIPDDLVDSCAINADGEIQCGDFIVQDARRNLREEIPDVVQKVKILQVSAPIPNDGLAFGPEFPEDLKTQIVDALVAFAADDPDGFATAFDAYSWDDVAPTSDADFDSIRAIVQALGIELADIG